MNQSLTARSGIRRIVLCPQRVVAEPAHAGGDQWIVSLAKNNGPPARVVWALHRAPYQAILAPLFEDHV
jgi:hypothetical protein